jgi:DNA-directed RNA polymerase subunit M/transcription elongation factor TFIIS
MDTRKLTYTYINRKIHDKATTKIIERSIYKYCKSVHTHFSMESPDHREDYIMKSKNIIYNLDIILPHIKDGTLAFPLEEIAFQSNIVLNPGKWETHIKKSDMSKKRMTAKPTASTNQFKCGRCGKNETTYYLLQTRSMDEPETAFITCVHCENKWRQNG